MAEESISVLIAEDEAVTRLGIKFALHTFSDVKVVGESADGVSAILQVLAKRPAVVLMDIGLPKVDGITAARKVKEALPRTKIIVFTCSEDEEKIHMALDAGVDGYCLKKVSGENLYSAIRAVQSGEFWLDPDLKPAKEILDCVNAEKAVRAGRIPQSAPKAASAEASPVNLESPEKELSKLLDYRPEDTPVINRTARSAGAGQLTDEQLAEQKASGASRTIIGDRYQIDKVLGKGGMGMVYKGRHIYMNRMVAIKILHPDQAQDESVVSRFHKEARSLCQFSHPNLVSVFDFGIMSTGEPYMVMDYCDGQSLDQILRQERRLSTNRALNLFIQACRALDAVHSQGIVHRDIKPSNLLVSEGDILRVVDFGLAKNVGGLEKLIKLTCTGEVVGSPSYMSPEQCTGQDLDHRSDIYSLGIAMYEALTGQLPYEADSFYEILNKHIRGNPPRQPFVDNNVPSNLEEIIFRCLDKDPDARFQSARELLSALEGVSRELQKC